MSTLERINKATTTALEHLDAAKAILDRIEARRAARVDYALIAREVMGDEVSRG